MKKELLLDLSDSSFFVSFCEKGMSCTKFKLIPPLEK